MDVNTCVNNCGTSGNEPYCHLCQDKLCTECDEYDNCNATKCATNASNSNDGSICVCDPGYVREVDSVVNEICNPCHHLCATCSASNITERNYSVCTACMTGTSYNTIAAGGAYVYCEAECPTNLADDGGG
jgi:hypothetical protein